MKILVIGGTGFIGPHVVRELARMGHSVTVFHRGIRQSSLPAESMPGDRRDLPVIRPQADVVIYLILSSGAQAASLMNAFRGRAQRVVIASSIRSKSCKNSSAGWMTNTTRSLWSARSLAIRNCLAPCCGFP